MIKELKLAPLFLKIQKMHEVVKGQKQVPPLFPVYVGFSHLIISIVYQSQQGSQKTRKTHRIQIF